MPRFEKSAKSSEHLFELVLEEPRVFTVEAQREKGAREWVSKDSNRRRYNFSDEPKGAAKAFYEKKVEQLTKKGYRLAGKDTPQVAAMREKSQPKATPAGGKIDAKHAAFIAELRAKKTVCWTGKKPTNANQFWEVKVEGDTVLVRTGEIGKKGKTEKERSANAERALEDAAVKMSLAASIRKFGP